MIPPLPNQPAAFFHLFSHPRAHHSSFKLHSHLDGKSVALCRDADRPWKHSARICMSEHQKHLQTQTCDCSHSEAGHESTEDMRCTEIGTNSSIAMLSRGNRESKTAPMIVSQDGRAKAPSDRGTKLDVTKAISATTPVRVQ